ncbi:Calcineurin-like protein phosphoesterase [Sarcoptes scabiei]|nr:Calcineurin-like protein phosphoesterase [Sarcoptes scabiei]
MKRNLKSSNSSLRNTLKSSERNRTNSSRSSSAKREYFANKSKSVSSKSHHWRFRPENGLTPATSQYDCCAFIIHCPQHNKILVSHQKNYVWLPFVSLLPNLGWEDNALCGFLIIISGANTTKYNQFKENSPFQMYHCLQVLRLQLPRTMKFLTRLIYYFKLKSDVPNFDCCQDIAHLKWYPFESINKNMIANLWGPELIYFVHRNPYRPTSINEYSLEEAFLYVPRDPPRNLEEDMLKSLRITEKDVERVYEDFLEHCFPSFSLTIVSFKSYMKKHGFEKNDVRLEKFFRAFNYHKTNHLTFHEFLLGLACMETSIQHGKFRVKFIFRYYSDDYTYLTRENLRKLLLDIKNDVESIESRLESAMQIFQAKKIDADKWVITENDFVSAIGSHKFRGTSTLCRYPKGIFTQISRFRVSKVLDKAQKVLSNVLLKRRYHDSCKVCKEKKYQLAKHLIQINNQDNRMNYKRILVENFESNLSNQNVRSSKPNDNDCEKSLHSIETVFNKKSAANIIIDLVRDFSANKGTVQKPNCLLQNRAEDLWKLLMAIYNDINSLLIAEKKCQKIKSPCYIMGDIHGNLEDLFSLEKVLWRQLPCVGANYLFLGDYVDRGQWGFECAIYLFAFKILCPRKVTLLRGNHEVRLLQTHYTYRRECVNKYGEIHGLKIWELTNRIFDKLPVCAVVDEAIFCAHGGLPHTVNEIDKITKIKQELRDPERESPAAWEILWSDPCHMQQFLEIADLLNFDAKKSDGFIKNTKRGTAFLFNEIGLNHFLRKNGLTHVIRAHEVPPLGYTFHFGDKCATIFSCSHYCGNDNECACVLVDTQRIRVIHLDTVNNASATD